jgi:hypothetical protein
MMMMRKEKAHHIPILALKAQGKIRERKPISFAATTSSLFPTNSIDRKRIG